MLTVKITVVCAWVNYTWLACH